LGEGIFTKGEKFLGVENSIELLVELEEAVESSG
jgi:hypothetical protein